MSGVEYVGEPWIYPHFFVYSPHVRPGSELVLGRLGASWSSKGATGTVTEDGNDLRVVRIEGLTFEEVSRRSWECKPGREVLGSGGRDRHPQALEGVMEKQYVVRHYLDQGPWACGALGKLEEVWGRLAHQNNICWGALVLVEGAQRLTRIA
ncbi:hypothetical protein F5876DRAFT_70736 [Lentinula aff. lateritia]|uniref:Uncharacterized protein n=1 Tax=Lentinula aff. lateritia TaxID=2804960 RepID=A0ACC1TIH0_9AGAR|nr:hypothetical protein F5876DRAFT_70736 [Lentinula aff. lateritia]